MLYAGDCVNCVKVGYIVFILHPSWWVALDMYPLDILHTTFYNVPSLSKNISFFQVFSVFFQIISFLFVQFEFFF